MEVKLGRRTRAYGVGAMSLLLTLALAAAVIYYWSFIQSLGAYGYLGAFLISAVGGATIIAPVPMTPVVFALGTVLHPVYVGVAAGVGETLGGLSIYLAGYGSCKALIEKKEGRFHKYYDKMMQLMGRSGAVTLFCLSATLNPVFYPAALAAGALRFRLWKFIAICLVGKTFKGIVVAYAGFYGLRQLLRLVGVQ